MDELHDAIQDAQYIGAVTNGQRGPSAAFHNPSHTELSQFAERQERSLGLDWLGLESILDLPLGFYFFRRFCEFEQQGGVQKLNFLVEVTKYRSLQTADQRLSKAKNMYDRFCASTVASSTRSTASSETISALGIITPTAPAHSASVEPAPPTRQASGAKLQINTDNENGGTLTGASLSPRHSLVNLTAINVAAMTTSGIVFWQRGRSTKSRADVQAIYKEAISDMSPLGVGGDVLKRVASFLKRKSSGMVRTASTTSTASPRSSSSASTAATSNPHDPASHHGNEAHSPSEKGANVRHGSHGRSQDHGSPPTVSQASVGRSEIDLTSCLETLFDELEACVLCSLELLHLKEFRASAYHRRLLAFLYLQTRRVAEEDFTVLRILGRGGFGMVNGCIKKTSASLYAMKVMNKKMIKKKHAEKLCLAERKILAMISSPFLVCLKYAFQTPDELFLVLDLRTGGDLSFHLNRCRFTELQVRFWAAQLLLGLQHLHEKNIVYRDLKPENILLDDRGNCSISDLGLAVEVTPTLTGRCGTRGYWAPEMLLRDDQGQRLTYNHAVDWWSYGCLVYEMLYGKCPFRTSKAKALHEDKQQAYDKATLELTPTYDPKYFSPEAAELIQQLLIRDPAKRLGARGAEEVKRMRFFDSVDWVAIENMSISPPFVPENDINAASQADIGSFDISVIKGVKLTESDQALYNNWDFVCPGTFQLEAIEYLEWEVKNGPCTITPNSNACCVLL